jgi:hypothetical protein
MNFDIMLGLLGFAAGWIIFYTMDPVLAVLLWLITIGVLFRKNELI